LLASGDAITICVKKEKPFMLKRISNLAAGLAVGGAIGGAAALLLTPNSGKNLRQNLKLYYQQVMLESAQAAEATRQELRAELNAKISPDKAALPAPRD
jgi:gas vesicle protein